MPWLRAAIEDGLMENGWERGNLGGEDYGLNKKCWHLLRYGPKDADWKSSAINVVASKRSHALTLILGGNHPPIARSQVVLVQS